jgi:hypothetical protein
MMLDVKVLGPGCANCNKLEEIALKAMEVLEAEIPGLETGYEKVTEPSRFIDFGLMSTPGLVVNGKLISSGRVPALSQVEGWYREALQV